MAKTPADEKPVPIDYKGIVEALLLVVEEKSPMVAEDTSDWGHEFRSLFMRMGQELRDKQRRLTDGTI
jgi:hypothetical protein